MNIEVKKEDILKIGDTTCPLDGYAAFILNSNDDSFWIKEIFLRNILRAFPKEYKIVSIEDFELDEKGYEVTKLVIKTDLPWEVLEQLNDTF